ncbi:MAG TPA: methyltransferase domain-containing protein, partial [Bryobacteraceae bacterium]|nr:methyltransferase domain-containing protein [Bryobacteraceae bacterium]
TATLPNFVRADAARLPFAAGSFDAIVSNHSLEHIENLEGALLEIGRVAKPGALLYVAVPDASTFTDKLYRWLARGGGHVNAFTSAEQLARKIQTTTGLKHRATRTLHSSFSFMNRTNRRVAGPRRMAVAGGGREWTLRIATYLCRICDRAFGTRLSVYGWALFFRNTPCEFSTKALRNVCIRCGAGSDAEWLIEIGAVSGRFPRIFRCPQCRAKNYFTRDAG